MLFPLSCCFQNAGLHVARDLLEPIKQKFPGCTYADLVRNGDNDELLLQCFLPAVPDEIPALLSVPNGQYTLAASVAIETLSLIHI